jgi:RNA polymerase sigma factor (sigma-70 family)
MTNEDLCAAVREGDNAALNTLWEQSDRLFYAIARSVYSRHRERAASCGVEYADCRQVCWFAFLDAVEAYNRAERTKKFPSFAGYHVRRHVYALLGLRTSKREPLNGADSIDAPLQADEGEYTIADTLADESAAIPFEDVANADIAREVLERVDTLSEQRCGIIYRRFWEGETLAGIAADACVNPTRIHSLYRDALRKLRRDERIRQIYDEYYSGTSLTKHTGFTFFRETGMSSMEHHLLRLEERLEREGLLNTVTEGGDEP